MHKVHVHAASLSLVKVVTFINLFVRLTDPLPVLCLVFCAAPLSTVGVDLGIWKYRKDLEPEYLKQKKKGAKQLRSVTFYTWDFGGQVASVPCTYLVYT